MPSFWRWILIGLAGVAVAAALARELFFGQGSLPEGLLQANGRIEGDPIYLNVKVPGRIVALPIEEGDTLVKGQLVAQLEDEAASARLAQAREKVAALAARIEAAEASLALATDELPLEIARAEAAVGRTNAAVEAADVEQGLRQREAERLRAAREALAAPVQELDRAESALTAAELVALSTRAARREAQAALDLARLGEERLRVQALSLEALRAERLLSEAEVREAESLVADLTIVAPAAGTVTSRPASIGEVVSPGMAIADLADLDRLYVKVYVPEPEIGKVRLGLPAQVHVDAFPGEPASATVGFIASRAEFTPREVQTPEERVKTVFAVKVFLDANPDRRFAPGMPADVVIRWKDEVPWQPPRW